MPSNLRLVMTEQKVKKLQEIFGLEQNGIIDNHTRSAVKNFNIRDGRGSDDTVDEKTIDRIFERFDIQFVNNDGVQVDDNDEYTSDINESTDIYSTQLLDSDEYVSSGDYSNKEYIFLHHTAGWDNPYKTIESWNSDSRGRIGTHFVIGGDSIRGESEHDGVVVKCIPDEFFAYHLGGTKKHGIDFYMHSHSVGIELCNFGQLIQRGQSFYTWAGQRVSDSQVCDLGFEFRGYRYWHKYSDKQLNSLYFLLKHLSFKHDIDLNVGLKTWVSTFEDGAFEFNEKAVAGEIKGLLSHTNVRKDKYDVFPQKEMIELIKSL